MVDPKAINPTNGFYFPPQAKPAEVGANSAADLHNSLSQPQSAVSSQPASADPSATQAMQTTPASATPSQTAYSSQPQAYANPTVESTPIKVPSAPDVSSQIVIEQRSARSKLVLIIIGIVLLAGISVWAYQAFLTGQTAVQPVTPVVPQPITEAETSDTPAGAVDQESVNDPDANAPAAGARSDEIAQSEPTIVDETAPPPAPSPQK